MRNLTNEQRAIILANRLTFSENDIQELSALLKNNIDWFQVLRYAAKNKIIPLVYMNIKKLGYDIPKPIRQIFKYYYLGTIEKNKIIIFEYNKIREAFAQNNIYMSPLKGAYLIPNMYIDLGIRTVNDIDCLIMQKDIKIVKDTLSSIGYVNGDFDHDSNSIVKINTKKDMLWKMKMNSLYPFRKIVDSPFASIIDVDFSFGLDLNKDAAAVTEMMKAGMITQPGEIVLQPAHFFIHQCCHHYKEASNAAWIIKGSDFNLIKFCDVREFIIKFMNSNDLNSAVSFANQYGFAKAVYFVLYYLKKIYDDGYEDEYLYKLNCSCDFLQYFGEKDFTSKMQWKKTFWERIFSDNNKDEIVGEARFLSLYAEE